VGGQKICLSVSEGCNPSSGKGVWGATNFCGCRVCLFVCLSVTVRLFVHLENGVCSLGCSATAYVRIRYQQLERIRTAAPAGAIAVAYFAFRLLIRVQGLLSAPSRVASMVLHSRCHSVSIS